MSRLTSAFQGNNHFNFEEAIATLDLNDLLKIKMFSGLTSLLHSKDFIELESTINNMNLNESIKHKIVTDLANKFQGNTYFRFEEAFILNTVTKDFKLSFEQSIKILNALRIKSISNANCKINHKVDSRLFEFLKSNN